MPRVAQLLKGDAALAKSKGAWQRAVQLGRKEIAIKLLDGGVKLESGGTQEVEGTKYDVLRVSFENVGMTPGDHYNLYVDPSTHMVKRWDYMPAPDKKTSGTWEKYEKFGPLTLATEHQFGGKRIYFTDVKVETDR